jgi:hypothetical protein
MGATVKHVPALGFHLIFNPVQHVANVHQVILAHGGFLADNVRIGNSPGVTQLFGQTRLSNGT